MEPFSQKHDIKTDRKSLRELRENAPCPPKRADKGVPAVLIQPKVLWNIDEINEETLKKIEQGLCWGWSNSAICLYARIDTKLFKKLQTFPELAERFAVLQQRPEMVARRNISMELEAGCTPTSKWFLERKTKDFAPKQQVDHTHKQEADELTVLAALEKLVLLSQQRKQEQLEQFGPIIDQEPEQVDDLLL